MQPSMKKLLLASLICGLCSQSAQAANWLMLQGTEKKNLAPKPTVWGFVQAEYQQTDDTKLRAGPNQGESAAFNQMAPQLTTPAGFNIKRARIGIRGNNIASDDLINYFMLMEFGNNGITTGKGASKGQLTDASVTFNHIPGARVRVGLFKTPGSEEAMQGIGVMNYIHFSNATNRLLLERFFDKSKGNAERDGPVGAFRDIGIQVFDRFHVAGWEASYALMFGNGHGLTLDNNKHKDTYVFAATEKRFGKAGPRGQSVKFYAWNQNGKRTLDDVGDKNRSRSGLGTTFWNGTWRFGAEYILADGMIFAGTTGAGLPSNGATFTIQPDQKADGYYLDAGYRVVPNLELNLRYDYLDSGTKHDGDSGTPKDARRQFTTTTLGAQYFINKKTTLTANYEFRDIKAPNAADGAAVHEIVKAIDNRLSLQVRLIF